MRKSMEKDLNGGSTSQDLVTINSDSTKRESLLVTFKLEDDGIGGGDQQNIKPDPELGDRGWLSGNDMIEIWDNY
jgi:hypothetical protein